jgi:hypothetical protein
LCRATVPPVDGGDGDRQTGELFPEDPGDQPAWERLGFTAAEAEHWRRRCPGSTADEAARWRAHGLGPDEVEWYWTSVLPTIADEWALSGWTGPEMYAAHRRRLTLAQVNAWRDAGTDLETTLEWAPFGFTRDEVAAWRSAGFRAAAASFWRRTALGPVDAAAAAAAGRLPVPAEPTWAIMLGRIPRPDDPPDVVEPPPEVRDRGAERAEVARHLRPGVHLPDPPQ